VTCRRPNGLVVEHAQWQIDNEHDESGVMAARRFAQAPLDHLHDSSPDEARTLLGLI